MLRNKSFLYGLGIGLVVIGVIFQLKTMITEAKPVLPQELTIEQIKAGAQSLGYNLSKEEDINKEVESRVQKQVEERVNAEKAKFEAKKPTLEELKSYAKEYGYKLYKDEEWKNYVDSKIKTEIDKLKKETANQKK